jgi:hypothetical protein
MPAPFGTSFRRDPAQPRDLGARIDAQIRERIEEAVDFVCLEALVEARRAAGLPPPSADRLQDRDEFNRSVHAFLERLRVEMVAGLSDEERRGIAQVARSESDAVARLVTIQATLARRLPDYWQRFDTTRARHRGEAPASSGEGRGLLRRLFGGG